MVVCSDGIWDALKEGDVAAIACRCATATAAAAKIVEKAHKRKGLHDDMTCLVVMVATDTSGLSGGTVRSEQSPPGQVNTSKGQSPMMRLKVRLSSSSLSSSSSKAADRSPSNRDSSRESSNEGADRRDESVKAGGRFTFLHRASFSSSPGANRTSPHSRVSSSDSGANSVSPPPPPAAMRRSDLSPN